jgi:putative iron-dependent peroxidase
MPNPQHAILTNLTKYQWYTHLSRTEGADLGVIKSALAAVRRAGSDVGVTVPVNVCLLFGPTLLADLTDDVPADFQPYPGYESPDGKVAKGTQEELLLWVHSADKDLCWETQFNFRNAVAGHMNVARETPTFIYRNSLDLSGFIDGTGNPAPEDQHDRAIVPEGEPGAGGSFCIAQRWVHDLKYFNGLSLQDQENTFGRTKDDSTKLSTQVPTSHLSHVELREGETADEATAKRGEMVRRSTPYAFHDGTVGLYFMGFCKTQAPMRERMEAIYGINGQARDALTDYSTPASGSYYFAPSVEALEAMLG